MQFSSIFRVGRGLFSFFFPSRKATGSIPLFTAPFWRGLNILATPFFCRLFQQSWTQRRLMLKVSKLDPGFLRHPWRVGLNWIPKFPGTASAVAPFSHSFGRFSRCPDWTANWSDCFELRCELVVMNFERRRIERSNFNQPCSRRRCGSNVFVKSNWIEVELFPVEVELPSHCNNDCFNFVSLLSLAFPHFGQFFEVSKFPPFHPLLSS